MRSTRPWLACLSAIWIASCAATDECAWARKIAPEAGFETRWTLAEKRQVVAHNRKVARFCR